MLNDTYLMHHKLCNILTIPQVAHWPEGHKDQTHNEHVYVQKPTEDSRVASHAGFYGHNLEIKDTKTF